MRILSKYLVIKGIIPRKCLLVCQISLDMKGFLYPEFFLSVGSWLWFDNLYLLLFIIDNYMGKLENYHLELGLVNSM